MERSVFPMESSFRFTKMHGCGNDYVYVNAGSERIDDPSALARVISDRRFGIGSDGLILILTSDAADFRMRMFNPDGSEAHCGNGLRCVAKFVYDHRMTDKSQLTIETLAGVLSVTLGVDDNYVTKVSANMGRPRLDRTEIPMEGAPGDVLDEPFSIDGETFSVTCLSMGNPHCVICVDDIESFPVATIGPRIENAGVFPERTNVEFVQVLSPTEVRQRTWERGAGETLACGTGASAVCVAGVLTGRTQEELLIHLAGGDLELSWKDRADVVLTGPAVTVYEGVYDPH